MRLSFERFETDNISKGDAVRVHSDFCAEDAVRRPPLIKATTWLLIQHARFRLQKYREMLGIVGVNAMLCHSC
jgi:hypothetical protein